MPETAEIPKGLEEFVQIRKEKIHINWDKLAKLKKEIAFGNIILETFNSKFDKVLEFLKSLGRLTYQKIDSFYLSCGGFDFGPKFSWALDSFSFSIREEAEDYAKAFGHHSVQSVNLYKIAKNSMYEILEQRVNRR